MLKIPYYDPADGSLINFLAVQKCEDLVKAGGAVAIRSKGEIKRLYRATKDRNFATAHQATGQIHAASSTTTRMRNDDQLVIAPPWIIQHK